MKVKEEVIVGKEWSNDDNCYFPIYEEVWVEYPDEDVEENKE